MSGVLSAQSEVTLATLRAEIQGTLRAYSDPASELKTTLTLLTNDVLIIETTKIEARNQVTEYRLLDLGSGRRVAMTLGGKRAVELHIEAVDRNVMTTGYSVQRGKTNQLTRTQLQELQFNFKPAQALYASQCAELWKELFEKVGLEVRFFDEIPAEPPVDRIPRSSPPVRSPRSNPPSSEEEASVFVTVEKEQITGATFVGFNHFIRNKHKSKAIQVRVLGSTTGSGYVDPSPKVVVVQPQDRVSLGTTDAFVTYKILHSEFRN